MGRHDSRHKKKSAHKKSHKKEKKKHKKSKKSKSKKHHKQDSESSSSDLSVSDSSPHGPGGDERELEESHPEGVRGFGDESGWNDIFSDRCATVKEKNVHKKDRHVLDQPGQSSRELNPYWKDGGDGLPPNLIEVKSDNEKNHDVKYLKNLLQEARDTSEVTGVAVEEIIEEEWGPLKKLEQIIQDAENEKSNLEGGKKGSFEHSGILSGEPKGSLRKEDSERGKGFMRPGEMSDFKYTNTYQRNWKKKETFDAGNGQTALDQSPGGREAEKIVTGESKKILTPDELNALAAKAMKAEIMGNKTLCEQLRKEIEEAKKNREETGTSDSKSRKGKEEIILLTKSNLRGMTKPCESSDYHVSDDKRKRRRGETHKDNQRIRYFMDDDKHSLRSMFESEKFGTGDQSDEMFVNMAKRGRVGVGSDLDDDFLDQVRDSNYERKERERERNRAVNESKWKHKSLSHCRWCLDGNDMKKHLVVSLGSKCYLCLPSEESLTDGHCLIVPIQHDACGTLLDEDVWNEVESYRKRLCRMFEESGQDVVFFENARSFHRHPHMVLNCVPMDKEIGDLAPIYFKKAIMESETEWSNNKKVIELKKRDVRRSVPKGLPYFAVDFGREGGFAHVIEDEKLFPWNFAEEIIGGMLDLDTHKWKKPRKESVEKQKEKVAEFMEMWKKYEVPDAENRLVGSGRSDSSVSD